MDMIPETPGGLMLLVVTIVCAIVLLYLLAQPPDSGAAGGQEKIAERDPEAPRNFTREQLHEFDGKDDETPAYVALRGEVFDVSSKPEFYKAGGAYHVFAGHDASVSLATSSFEPAELDSSWDKLNPMETANLDEWVEKFKHYNSYPVVGRVVTPLPDPARGFTVEELRGFNGTGEAQDGYAAPSIYVGMKGKVYDMSFGGTEMYGPGKSYHLFAGRDASVALAKLSFAPEALDNPDISQLTPQEMEVLDDWVSKLGKKYPVVGVIKSG